MKRIGLMLTTACALTLGASTAAWAGGTGTLSLVVANGSECVQPGETVVVELYISDLGANLAAGYQAFLEYDAASLDFTAALNPDPYETLNGGLGYNEPFGSDIITLFSDIHPPATNEINLAAGINDMAGQLEHTGDALTLIATLRFAAKDVVDCASGGTIVSFRDNGASPPNPPSRISDEDGNEITTIRLDSDGIVVDGVGPDVTCPTEVSVKSDLGDCDAFVDLDDPIISDTCTATGDLITSVSFFPAAPTGLTGLADGTYPVGTTIVTYFVTDCAGNVTSCPTLVTVVDNEDPSFACPGNIVLKNDPGDCGAVVSFLVPTATDNCGVGPVVCAPASGTLFPVGSTDVVCTATDVNGNTATCTFTVTVNDNEDPVITCPADVTVRAPGITCEADIVYAPDVTATDNCAFTPASCDIPSGSTFAVGSHVVTCSVTDASGNTAECTFSVVVLDNENPTLDDPDGLCGTQVDFTTDPGACDVAGATVLAALSSVSATDTCSGVSTEITRSDGLQSGEAYPKDDTTVTITFRDSSGNSITCTITVHVDDDEAPAITGCPTGTIFGVTDPGLCTSSTVNAALPNIDGTDNCPKPVTVIPVRSDNAAFDLTDPFPKGITTITYTVSDTNGNSDTCVVTVDVLDKEPPTIIDCPGDETVNTDADACVATLMLIAPTATDNCPLKPIEVTKVARDENGDVFDTADGFPKGINTVTWSFDDGNTVPSECVVTVTVIDNQGPMVVCPAGTTTTNTDLDACVSTTFVLPTLDVDDNCPKSVTTDITYTDENGDTFDPADGYPKGDNVVVWTFTDSNGNPTSCTLVVTVVDNQAPDVTCPADPTIFSDTDLGDCVSTTITLPTLTATDNCKVSVTTATEYLDETGTVFDPTLGYPKGINTVTWTFDDLNGNTSECAIEVVVSDVEAALVDCPANVTVDTDPGLCSALVALGDPVVDDNCPAKTPIITGVRVDGDDLGDPYPVGTTTVNYTIDDGNGNISTCTTTVTVEDNADPTLSACPGNTTVKSDPGLCGAVVTWTAVTVMDNCPGATISSTHNSGDFFPVGDTPVLIVGIDASLNTVACSFTVTVNDNEEPTISCPADITAKNDPGVCGAVITFPTPGASDNCPDIGAVTQTGGPTSGSVFPIGPTVVSFEVTDDNGNTAGCFFTVTVSDNEQPEITCPDDIVVNLPPAAVDCETEVSWDLPTFDDNCPGSFLVAPVAPNTQTLPVGDNIISYTVEDASGNQKTCQFTVTVRDQEAPEITCPASVTLTADAGECGAIHTYTAPVGTDNCPDPVTELTAGLASGEEFPVGTTRVTYTVTDAGGNMASCNFTVTVLDTEDPTITCPGDTTIVANEAGLCGAVVNFTAPVGVDNCDSTTVGTHASGDFFPVGITPVTFTVTDASGNTDDCTFNVEVVDTENPTIANCPTDITVNTDPGECTADVTWTVPTADDNCPNVILVGNMTGTATLGVGMTTVKYIAVDASNNSAVCMFKITVIDSEPPVITCPDDITIACASDLLNLAVVGSATASDNCAGVLTPAIDGDDNNGGAGCLGSPLIVTRTWSATDGGTTVTCTQTITVIDEEDPAFTGVPLNISVNADAGTCEAIIVSIGTATADDNCGVVDVVPTRDDGEAIDAPYPAGVTTITWTATDPCGNDATVDQLITVSAFNEMALDLELRGTHGGFPQAPDCEVCITFELYNCVTNTTATHRELITFTNGAISSTFSGTIEIPCGDWTCITARDELHTLRRTLDVADGFAVNGGTNQYDADFAGAAKDLIGGNANDDFVIDILDFGVFSSQFTDVLGASDCTTVAPHADFDCSGTVDPADFSFISGGFLDEREDNCCGLSGFASPAAGEMEISVEELWARGLGHLSVGDLNGDGLLNVADMAAFAEGARPATLAVFNGQDGGSWFDSGNWTTGEKPGAETDVAFQVEVVVDRYGAVARNVTVHDGGTLRLDRGGLSAKSVTVKSGGTLAIEGLSELVIESLTLELGSTLEWASGVMYLDGGVITAPAGFTVAPAGSLVGHGLILGDLVNHGRVAPVGTLAVEGRFAQTSANEFAHASAGVLSLALTPEGHDQLIVSGSALLGGVLDVELTDGFVPEVGASFDAALVGKHHGAFDVLTSSELGDGLTFELVYEDGLIRLIVTQTAPGMGVSR